MFSLGSQKNAYKWVLVGPKPYIVLSSKIYFCVLLYLTGVVSIYVWLIAVMPTSPLHIALARLLKWIEFLERFGEPQLRRKTHMTGNPRYSVQKHENIFSLSHLT